jgi:hypothetical protein
MCSAGFRSELLPDQKITSNNFSNVFFNFESKYETHFTLTLIVFALEGGRVYRKPFIYTNKNIRCYDYMLCYAMLCY